MSRLSEALEQIDRVMDERRSPASSASPLSLRERVSSPSPLSWWERITSPSPLSWWERITSSSPLSWWERITSPSPLSLRERVRVREVPTVPEVAHLNPGLVWLVGLTGIVGLALLLASRMGWPWVSSDQATHPGPSAAITLPVTSSLSSPPSPSRGEGQGGGEKEDLRRQGERAARGGDYDEAEVAFRRFLELDPTSAEAYNNLGVIYIQRGAVRKGIEALRSALRLSSDYAEATLNLAVALERQGEIAEATTYYRRFLSLAGEERRLERERVINHLASGLQKR